MKPIGLALFLITAAGLPAEPPVSKAPARIKIVRQMYEKIPPLILDIAEPVTVTKAVVIEDGGTTAVDFKDAKGKTFTFALDRKIGSATRETMFFMGDDAKKPVMVRGPEEAALYGMLLRWKKPATLDEYSVFSVGVMLDHLDARFASLPVKKAP